MIRDPKDCPYYLISRTTLAVTAEMKRELIRAGVEQVKPSYLGVLMSLWKEDGLKVNELGRRAGLEPSTMTSILDRMEQDRLLSRSHDTQDRRAQIIHLTDEGRAAKDASLAVVDKTLEKVLSGINKEDIDRMKEILRIVISNTDKADL